jgi:photosynthetic reaction center cytochrome c subunit
MKLNVLRVLVVTLLCSCAVMLITNARAQKLSPADADSAPSLSGIAGPRPVQTPTSPAAAEKSVEQVQKNIKVLTGLPQSHLIPVMNYIAASMGRRCNFCHVNNSGEWDYASDVKQEKNTAREMIKMVLDLNKTSFKGNLEVSCYTCHRGVDHPASIPVLPLPVPSPGGARPGGPSPGGPGSQPQGSPTARPPQPTGDDILKKYVDAIGGQAAIDKITSRVMKGEVTTANGNTGTYEVMQIAPDKGYESFVTQRGSMERAFTGAVGWEKTAQGVRELNGQDLVDLKLLMQLFRNLRLKEQYTTLRMAGRDRIGDRAAIVVLGTTADRKRERLFFDAENGLLLRRISYLETMIAVIPQQTDFEDYRDVEGVKLPFTIRVSSVDAANPYITRKFTEIKLNAAVDESKFKMPPKPATP